ncbi:Protein of unknown function [Gryllus bimaculatus]|nr:Protein of unknown function [Gryllus bimaculatus]
MARVLLVAAALAVAVQVFLEEGILQEWTPPNCGGFTAPTMPGGIPGAATSTPEYATEKPAEGGSRKKTSRCLILAVIYPLLQVSPGMERGSAPTCRDWGVGRHANSKVH